MSCACDGRPLGERLKAQIGRELDRLEPLLKRIAAVEEAREAMLARRLASQREGDRAGVRRRRLDGGALPLFRQPPVGWRLRRPRADAVAQRCDRPRAGGLSKAGNPPLAQDHASARLVVAHPPAAIGAFALVSRALPGMSGKAARERLMIVALARRLFVAPWKVTAPASLEGAVMKPAA